MEKPQEEKATYNNWSEEVEDLVASGDTEAAIAFLETLVSKLQTQFHSSRETVVGLQLASALTELANFYSSKGYSLKSDKLRSQALLLKQRDLQSCYGELKEGLKADHDVANNAESETDVSALDRGQTDGDLEKSKESPEDDRHGNASSGDDWEAIADREPNELIPPQPLPQVSSLSPKDTDRQDTNTPKIKRRGRGTFSYQRNELYSDRNDDFGTEVEDLDQSLNSKRNAVSVQSKYGTRHVLVLADFHPSMKTIQLEKVVEDFKDHGVVIRWVNDTTALAVFRSPSIALDALNHIRCPFTVRILNEDDILLNSISTEDLEPPRQRPQTSARTAQRLIAQVMGLKLPSQNDSSGQFTTQEKARKNRLVARQKMREEAWGSD